MYLPDNINSISIKQELDNIYKSDSASSEISDNFKVDKKVYKSSEFEQLWWDVPWAMYLLSYKPEILQHKPLLEAIRKTNKIEQITLEWEWAQWFIMQLSDICIKFKNQDSQTDLGKELSNYKKIEQIVLEWLWDNPYYNIPQLERHLCDKNHIVMEYIPWFSLATNFVLKDKKISPELIYDQIFSNMQHSMDDIEMIRERLSNYYIDKDNILDYIKEHELRTILYYMGVDEDEFGNVSSLDTIFLIDYCLWSASSDYVNIYKKFQKLLRENNILSIDDHGSNIKLHNNKLYGLDFGNIVYSKKYK